MIIDDKIVLDYIAGKDVDKYSDHWIFNCFGASSIFSAPDPKNIPWVKKLYLKLIEQIHNFEPRNYSTVKRIFPNFDRIASEYTIFLVVGFPDPYDAMVLEHDRKNYLVFDLIQFGEESLNEDYSCHRVLTHEMIHLCLAEDYPDPVNASYIDDLDYTAFNEGFAHALSFPDDIGSFEFDDYLEKRFEAAKRTLESALKETDTDKQARYLRTADTGEYWDKFAAIAGKLYLLKNKDRIDEIYHAGWHGFSEKIIRG